MTLQFTLLHNCCRRRVPNASVHPCIYFPISNSSVPLICAAKELCGKVLDGSALHCTLPHNCCIRKAPNPSVHICGQFSKSKVC